MVSHSMTQVGELSRRIVSGALVLALAGLAALVSINASKPLGAGACCLGLG